MKPLFNITRLAQLTITGILIWLPMTVSAIVIGWQPGSYLTTNSVGYGMVLNNQVGPYTADPFVACSPTPTLLDDGWQSENITFSQNVHDINKTTFLNSEVSLNFLASGSANLTVFGSQTFDANDLVFTFSKIRNFGTMLYAPLGISPFYTNIIAQYQRVWQGEALNAKITNLSGTHYVRGYQRAISAAVQYDFHYDSAAVKQVVSVSGSGSAWGVANFSDFVNSYFASTNNSTRIHFTFWASSQNPMTNLPTSGDITNFTQFTNYVASLEHYVNTTPESNAVPTAWVLDPISTIPGYLSLVDGYVPAPVNTVDYGGFFEAYSALLAWQQRLQSLVAGGLTWLSPAGINVISNKLSDINSYVAAMNNMTKTNSTFGGSLNVPDDVVACLANMSDIELPEIYVMDTFLYGGTSGDSDRCVLGRVDCGPTNLVQLPEPFSAVHMLNRGTNNGDVTLFAPTAQDFYSASLARYPYSVAGTRTIYDHLTNLFASAQWACLSNSAINPDADVYFLEIQPTSKGQDANWSIAIGSALSTSNVDVMSMLDTRSGGCGASSPVSNILNVGLSIAPPADSGVVGLAQPVTMQITNQTSAQAYGTSISFPLSRAFDFGGASGSQGYVNYSNGVVTYTIGPLLPGASANVTLQLIPLQAGLVMPSTLASLSLGQGLTNSSSMTNPSFLPIPAAAPVLNMARGPGSASLLIDWWSDTDRLGLDNSPVLGAGASWSPVINTTNAVPLGTHHLFWSQPINGKQGYFRLHSR